MNIPLLRTYKNKLKNNLRVLNSTTLYKQSISSLWIKLNEKQYIYETKAVCIQNLKEMFIEISKLYEDLWRHTDDNQSTTYIYDKAISMYNYLLLKIKHFRHYK